MANALERKNRHVIPNFRGFAETVELGELDRSQIQAGGIVDMSIEGTLFTWRRNPSIGVAADLMSGALVAGKTSLVDVREAAKFILDHGKATSLSQKALARRILGDSDRSSEEPSLQRIKDFIDEGNKRLLYQEIHRLRTAATRFVKDPILFVELARYYSILGQKDQAKKNMLIALSMAPENRYVIRSFVRLFAHFDEKEYAYDFLRRSPMTLHDPWLLSAEIALSSMLQKNSHLIRHSKGLVKSSTFSPRSLAELTSALGTVELLAGDRKKAKNLLKQALSDPNDNTLAQVEWALTKDRLFDVDISQFSVKRNFEALARESFVKLEWAKVIEHTEKWFMDMPFARRPIILGSHVASVALDNQIMAETFCKAGLVAHPGDPLLLNNLAYSLALENKLDDARLEIDKVQIEEVTEETTRTCLTATKGLINFREGHADEGRRLYMEAIQDASRMRNAELYNLAIINYVREELLSGSQYISVAAEMLNKVKLEPRFTTLKILLERVKGLAEKSQLTQ